MNFDKQAKYYNRFRRADTRLTNTIISLLHLDRNARIADIGAGTGNYATAIKDHGYLVYAVEPSREMQMQSNDKNMIWINSSAEDIDMPSDAVDGVIVINALHHFGDLRKVFDEIKRIIKDGPLLIFTFDPEVCRSIWLYDYWPQARKYIDDNYIKFNSLTDLLSRMFLSDIEVSTFEVPDDFRDIFSSAAWKHPSLLLESDARRAMSLFNCMDQKSMQEGLKRLHVDIHSGTWESRYSYILSHDKYDVGCRFIRINVNHS